MTVTSGAGTRETVTGEPSKRRRRGRPELDTARNRLGYYLITPAIVMLLVVIGYPVVRAIIMSFQKDPGLDPATGLFSSGGFAGFSNYVHWIFQRCGNVKCPPGTLGSQFWPSMSATIFFTVASVIIEVVLGMWMALVMSRAFKGRGLLRASVLVPWSIPTAVTALLILAGLQIIPADVYEAAKVDGATAWQRFTRITLPLVKPALLVAILFRTLDVLRIFDLPYILTGGANGTTTLSILVVNQIRQGFNSAAALSTITFLFIFLVAFLFVKLLGANVVQTQQSQQKGAR